MVKWSNGQMVKWSNGQMVLSDSAITRKLQGKKNPALSGVLGSQQELTELANQGRNTFFGITKEHARILFVK